MTDYSKAYKYDFNGYYIGIVDCQIDPRMTLETGEDVYLLPANSTYIEPLPEKENFLIKWDGEKWIYEDNTPYTPSPAQIEVAELKQQLADTDYKIIKCSEYSLAGQDLPYDIAALHAERQALRDRINELENE